jgi:hypothetical protein
MARFLFLATAGVLALGACTTPPQQAGAQNGAPVNRSLDALSSLTTNETVQLSNGQTARVDAVWSSALGEQCMRLTLTPAQRTEIACHGPSGWYELRDVTGPGGL